MKHTLAPLVAAIAFALAGVTAHAAPDEGSAAEAISSTVLPEQELTADTLFLILLGEIAGNRGDLPVSAEAYLYAAEQTQDPRIARRATEIALAARDLETAAAAARIWRDTDPNSADARRMLAGILAARGEQMNEVKIELARILAHSEGPRLEQNLLGLNRALAPMPDKQLVRSIVERLTRPYLQHPAAHLAIAQAAAHDNDGLAALNAADHALQLRPDWEPAVVLKAQLLVQLDAVQDALALLRDHLSRHPDNRNAGIAYARGLVANDEYENALNAFQQLLEGEPHNADLMYAVAIVAAQLGYGAIASTHFEQALTAGHPEQDSILMNLGRIAEIEQRKSEALHWYRQVPAGAYHVDAQLRIAHLLALSGELEAARALLEEIEVPPEEQRRLLLAEILVLREAGDHAGALGLVESALLETPEDPDLLYEAGMLAEHIDALPRMERHLRRLIELDPDHAHAYNALGYSLADRGLRLDEAEALLSQALELAPDDPFILDSMGWVRFRRDDPSGALQYLERAYALRPDPEIAAHLSEVLWALNRRKEALDMLQRSLLEAPEHPVLIETLQRLHSK